MTINNLLVSVLRLRKKRMRLYVNKISNYINK